MVYCAFGERKAIKTLVLILVCLKCIQLRQWFFAKHQLDNLVGAFKVDGKTFSIAAFYDHSSNPRILEQKSSGVGNLKSQVVSFILIIFFYDDDVILPWPEWVAQLIGEIKLRFFLWIDAFVIVMFSLLTSKLMHPVPLMTDAERQQEFFNLILMWPISSQYFVDLCWLEPMTCIRVGQQAVNIHLLTVTAVWRVILGFLFVNFLFLRGGLLVVEIALTVNDERLNLFSAIN